MNTINWKTTLFIVGYHLVLLATLPFFFIYGTINWPIIATTIVLWFVTGISVTISYHRLYAHQAYKAHWLLESILLYFAAMSVQGSAYSWAYDHRLHHAYSDTDRDPYSVKDGFWHAHILWMFKRLPKVDPRLVRDLEKNPRVMNQHKYYVLWMAVSNLSTTLFVGWLTGAYLTSFLFILGVRMFLCHHCTWFINSLAHHWGTRTFSTEQSAVDNYFLSIFTFGEGYHNYHHTFARDYRNGIRWYHFDPTKWSIWIFSKIGLAGSLNRIPANRINEKMVIEQKDNLLDQLRNSLDGHQEALTAKVRDMYEELMQLFERLKDPSIKSKDPAEKLNLEKKLKQSRKGWMVLVRQISNLPSQ